MGDVEFTSNNNIYHKEKREKEEENHYVRKGKRGAVQISR